MTRTTIAAVVLALAAVVACGEPNVLDSGTVVDREYDDPDQVASQNCISWDRDGWCRNWLTTYHTEPARYRLQIRGYDDEAKERTEWHSVTPEEYDAHQIGDRWGVG